MLFNKAVCYENPLAIGTKRGIAEKVAKQKKNFCKNFYCDVDVGWERSEPSSKVKYLLPVSAVRTHMKAEIDGTAVRFRLTEQST